MSINYRTASPSELEALYAFLNLSEIDSLFNKKLSQREISVRERVRYVFRNGYWVLAIDTDSSIAGCIGVKKLVGKKDVEASTLAVHPEYKDQGIGIALGIAAMGKAVELFKTNFFYADSWKGNWKMESLLVNNGFEKVSEFEDPKKRPKGVKTVLYRRNLKSLGNETSSADQVIDTIWKGDQTPKPEIDNSPKKSWR